MGLVTGTGPGAGIGNTVGPETLGVSGKSATQMDIYNYNKITIHYTTGKGNKNASDTMVLTNTGCVFNGQPQWDYEDGTYDGDFDVPYISHTGHHHLRHVDGRFGSALCNGQSHQLRYGGNGEGGNWEIVTHGRVSAWTSATTKNFFGIQGTGNTETGQVNSTGVGGLGTWQMVSATTTINGVEYGTWNHTTGTTRLAASMASISATTAFGVIL